MTIGARWPHYDVIAVLRGEIALEVEGEEFALSEGDAVVIPPDHLFHGAAVAEEAVIWVFHFAGYEPEWAGSPFDPGDPDRGEKGAVMIPKAAVGLLDRMLMEEFTKRWMALAGHERALAPEWLLAERNSRDFRLMGELLLHRFEEAFLRSRQEEPPRLRAAIEETLNGNLHYDVGTMARLAGVCPSRFRQLFAKYYGMSPVKFLLRARMEKARRLLSETTCPIKEVGRIAGYGELAAFHHAFSREVGMTPGVYRKRYGGVV